MTIKNIGIAVAAALVITGAVVWYKWVPACQQDPLAVTVQEAMEQLRQDPKLLRALVAETLSAPATASRLRGYAADLAAIRTKLGTGDQVTLDAKVDRLDVQAGALDTKMSLLGRDIATLARRLEADQAQLNRRLDALEGALSERLAEEAERNRFATRESSLQGSR